MKKLILTAAALVALSGVALADGERTRDLRLNDPNYSSLSNAFVLSNDYSGQGYTATDRNSYVGTEQDILTNDGKNN